MSTELPAMHSFRAPTVPCLAALLVLAVPMALAQTAPQQGELMLHVQTQLVLEDIVVLDGHNQPVHGLSEADFTITDNGKPVTPQSFEEHSAPTPAQWAAQQAATPGPPSLGVNGFTNRNAIPADTPLNVLVFDTLNTPVNDQAHVRQKMLRFLANLPPGTPLAIYGLSSRLYVLQGFTSDPKLLKAAVNTMLKQGKVQPSNLQQSETTNGASLEQQGAGTEQTLLESANSGGMEAAGDLEDFMAADNLVREQQREERTIAAIDQLARYLSILPGRKNLIWCSGSFPLRFIIPALNQNNPQTHQNFSEQLHRMHDLLARGQVAMYPVDASGLTTNPGTQADMMDNPQPARGINTASNNMSFMNQTVDNHAPMDLVAEETGGKAFYNSDDLTAEIENAVAFGANYYTVSYAPPSGGWDGKYHKIDVKVNRHGLHLAYRRGYYADNPVGEDHDNPVAPSSAMEAAMLHGAPNADGVLFNVNITPAEGTTEQLDPGNHPDTKLMQPPYRSCSVQANLDAHTLTLAPDASGSYESTVVFAMVVYDADGHVVNQGIRTGRVVVPQDHYADVLAHGLGVRQSIDVPARGNYFLRVAFHDPASDRVGAVEIPVAALKPEPAPGVNPPTQQ